MYYGKIDLVAAFRMTPLKRQCYPWVMMAANDPKNNTRKYFVEKNLSFGHSISCSHFQRFSRCLKHILEYYKGRPHLTTAYLDDFLFMAPSRQECNYMVRTFISICQELGVPVTREKTVFATPVITFLGVEMNGNNLMLTVPLEKKLEAENRLKAILEKRKAKVKELESLAGLLNFINKVVVPRRAFTRRMYAKFPNLKTQKGLKKHHLISLDQEFKSDCRMWLNFLNSHNDSTIVRPYLDINDSIIKGKDLDFMSDASASEILGYGSYYNENWLFGRWEQNFIRTYNPSIEFLELYTFMLGALTWWDSIVQEARTSPIGKVYLFCDNDPVVKMINHTTSSCKYCMILIRLLTIKGINSNIRVRAKYISTSNNYLSDSL